MREIWTRMCSTFSRGGRDPLGVRAGSTRRRDAYKVATAGLTGATAISALAVTGAVAGTAARQQAEDAVGEAAQPQAPSSQVVTKRRPHRTVVRTRVVHTVSGSGVATPGQGGPVSSGGSWGGSSGGSSGGGSGGSSGSGASQPAPPPPPPPAPAPSSGS